MRQSSTSTKFVWCPVGATKNGSAYNPTGDAVSMAFMKGNAKPGSGDWHTGVWQTATTGNLTTYYAGCLVGPQNSGVVLAIGDWNVFVDIVDNPENPQDPAGVLTIY